MYGWSNSACLGSLFVFYKNFIEREVRMNPLDILSRRLGILGFGKKQINRFGKPCQLGLIDCGNTVIEKTNIETVSKIPILLITCRLLLRFPEHCLLQTKQVRVIPFTFNGSIGQLTGSI